MIFKFITGLLRILTVAAISLGLILICGFFIYSAIILMWDKNPDKLEKSDAIIVLTGSKGRITAGFELLLENKAEKLLITGVQDKVSMNDILTTHAPSSQNLEILKNHCCISLDYAADTTEENANEAQNWIKNNNIQSIILVTSSYHMPRAHLQFSRKLDNEVDMQLYPVGENQKDDRITEYQFWKIAAREYVKYVGSWLRLERQQSHNY